MELAPGYVLVSSSDWTRVSALMLGVIAHVSADESLDTCALASPASNTDPIILARKPGGLPARANRR